MNVLFFLSTMSMCVQMQHTFYLDIYVSQLIHFYYFYISLWLLFSILCSVILRPKFWCGHIAHISLSLSVIFFPFPLGFLKIFYGSCNDFLDYFGKFTYVKSKWWYSPAICIIHYNSIVWWYSHAIEVYSIVWWCDGIHLL